MAGNVHGDLESFSGGIQQSTLQILLRRECNGMYEDVELAPLLRDLIECRLELTRLRHIEHRKNGRFELFCQWLDVGLRLRIQISDRQFCAELAKGFRTAVGDRLVVGDTYDKRLRAVERGAWNLEGHDYLLDLH